MRYMDYKQTNNFVVLWNERNGFSQGEVDQPNMRIVKAGLVTWNEYDAPTIDLVEIEELLSQCKLKNKPIKISVRAN